MIEKIRFKGSFYKANARYVAVKSYLRYKNLTPNVLSVESTVKKIIVSKSSVARFGDGEIRLMRGEDIEFQNASKELSLRLQEVLRSNEKGIIICIPDVFSNLNQYKDKAKYIWIKHLAKYYGYWAKSLNSDTIYYNAFITRPYIIYKSITLANERFNSIKSVWHEKNIIIIEGSKSRLGLGNDLFDNTKSIKRILCPTVNAFSKYNDILEEAKKIRKDNVILIALGPTATVLAYDLHQEGYQAIDIGHIDIEYEWYKMKANWTINVPDKHTNEALDNKAPEHVSDVTYNLQIIATVL
ncbi:SP_1767 family glycosyltransferase [Pontibacter liquoris]|uniref:SP_1767 family glycosyltransferase n=1 Tax=Pontibacter liquoris TaxID=2905677 RepID=UPI001FA6B0BC|nr:SP_1767 family glycosyltransferase [Pontibacter liquoris]